MSRLFDVTCLKIENTFTGKGLVPCCCLEMMYNRQISCQIKCKHIRRTCVASQETKWVLFYTRPTHPHFNMTSTNIWTTQCFWRKCVSSSLWNPVGDTLTDLWQTFHDQELIPPHLVTSCLASVWCIVHVHYNHLVVVSIQAIGSSRDLWPVHKPDFHMSSE